MKYRIASKKLKLYITLDIDELDHYVLKPLGYSKDGTDDLETIKIANREMLILYSWTAEFLKRELDNHTFLPKDTKCGPRDFYYDFTLFEKEFRLFGHVKKDRLLVGLVFLYFFIEDVLKDEEDVFRIGKDKVRGIRRREKEFFPSQINFVRLGLNIRINVEQEIVGNKLLLKIQFYALSHPIDFSFPKNPPGFSRKFISVYNANNELQRSIFLNIGSYLLDIPKEEKMITTKDCHEYIHECIIKKSEDGRTEIHLGSSTYSLKDGEEYYLTVRYSNKISNQIQLIF